VKKLPIISTIVFWGAIALIVIGAAARLHFRMSQDDKVDPERLSYELTLQELAVLSRDAAKGDCVAAYTVAQYHLYRSLDIKEAEKYYRLAAKCPHAKAVAGLINVLRNPEDDAEINMLLASLSKLDPKMGKDATEDVELRRAERASQ
jgi:hypothetical protein